MADRDAPQLASRLLSMPHHHPLSPRRAPWADALSIVLTKAVQVRNERHFL